MDIECLQLLFKQVEEPFLSVQSQCLSGSLPLRPALCPLDSLLFYFQIIWEFSVSAEKEVRVEVEVVMVVENAADDEDPALM